MANLQSLRKRGQYNGGVGKIIKKHPQDTKRRASKVPSVSSTAIAKEKPGQSVNPNVRKKAQIKRLPCMAQNTHTRTGKKQRMASVDAPRRNFDGRIRSSAGREFGQNIPGAFERKTDVHKMS